MTQDNLEFYSYTRATRSVRRADVVLLFLDAVEEISQVDKRLARFIADEFKPCIIVLNKWDLVKERATTEQFADYVEKMLPGLNYAPLSFITATQGKNVQSLLDLAAQLFKQSHTRVTTGQINRALETIAGERVPAARKKVGLPRIYYGTQVSVAPPTIILFVNNPEFFDDNYHRFLLHRLRELLPFNEIPLRLLIRDHHQGRESDND